MAIWGQEWIDEEPSLENIDVRFLMWDIRRNVTPADFLPDPFTVRFDFADAPDGLTEHWLVFERGKLISAISTPDTRLTSTLKPIFAQ